MKANNSKYYNIYNIFGLIITIIPLVFPLLSLYPVDPTGTFNLHIAWAELMAEKNSIVLPHFLYQFLIILIHKIFPFISFNIIGFFIVPLATHFYLAWIIQSILIQQLKINRNGNNVLWTLPIVFVMLVINPINFFTYPTLYLKYIALTVHHSATTSLAKPFSIMVFFYIIKILKHHHKLKNQNQKYIIYLAIFTILSLLAKPSYIICLIPSILVLVISKIIRKNSIPYMPLLLGFLIPSFLVLLWQYNFTYITNQIANLSIEGQSSIVFDPFLVISYFYQSPLDVFTGFILSIPFPLFIYLAYFNKTNKSLEVNLAWVTFCFGVFYFYFLAEGGEPARTYSANFAWSAQLTLFVLFFVSLVFFLKQFNFKDQFNYILRRKFIELDSKVWLGIFILFLHFVGGIVYLIYVTQTKDLGFR